MTISTSPRVSVIVTTKNNEVTLDACLKSIQSQSYKNIELIVVDNNSTDTTKGIARLYTKHVYDKGPERSAQRNYAAHKAEGTYLLIIDSDMELGSTIIADCIKAISTKSKAVIIPEESFGEGFWAACKALERSFYVGIDWIEAPRFFNKELFLEVGGYDEDIVGGEDWDLHSRIKKKTEVSHIKSFIRHNEGKLTLKEIINSRKYYAQGFTKHYDKKKPNTDSRSGAAQAIGVYKLLLGQPMKLFKTPLQGIGVLVMKTVEFGTIGMILIMKKNY